MAGQLKFRTRPNTVTVLRITNASIAPSGFGVGDWLVQEGTSQRPVKNVDFLGLFVPAGGKTSPSRDAYNQACADAGIAPPAPSNRGRKPGKKAAAAAPAASAPVQPTAQPVHATR